MTHQPELLPDQPSPDQTTRDAERAEYLERLREKLQDPGFRAIGGFPIGDDEDILALSDPPYYTACPNPFLPEIVVRWQAERAQLRAELGLPDDSEDNGNLGLGIGDSEPVYQREPFASDVSEGKNDPIYNAHSYHTKVPHKAVMRYILHYTDPGDVVFDGFCGTGMTGVAAQLCGDRKAVEDLGYRVDDEGNIFRSDDFSRSSATTLPRSNDFSRRPGEATKVATTSQSPISKLGARKAVLVDLSPAATFIAYNYNTPVDMAAFEREANRILREVEEECGWMYETMHTDGKTRGKINYTVWSAVFTCPECGHEMVFWDVAVNQEAKKVKGEFLCPNCSVELNKLALEPSQETVFDTALERPVRRAEQVPVLVNYFVGQKRHRKIPDAADLALLRKAESGHHHYWFPTTRIDRDIDIWYERDYRKLGVYSVDSFFAGRNLRTVSTIWKKLVDSQGGRPSRLGMFSLTGILGNLSKMNRWPRMRGPLTGTLYIPSIYYELNPLFAFQRRYEKVRNTFRRLPRYRQGIAMTTQSATQISGIPNSSIDYIFTDPPFGSNIIYSDLSIIWESWLRVSTSTLEEAVVHRRKQTNPGTIETYRTIMTQCFSECYRVLKPGRWLTVEFHNTQNSIWNSIQESILRAGFVVADVRTLDKKQGTFKQVTSTGTVKQDLVISAYKPHTGFERRFLKQAGTTDGAWAFVRQHLAQLPVVVERDGALEAISERQDYLLFDRMVAFHIQRGATVPLSAAGFYAGLRERFVERDGMYFLSDQVPEYDRARLQAAEVAQLTLFVSDEKSTIQWLRQQLDPSTGGHPQTYQELQPQFLRQLHQARHEVLPELSEMLEQNFLQDEAGRWYVADPGKASDLEKLRQRALLREFAGYVEGRGRLRKFRTEAVRAGFADGWHRRDYGTIVKVAERLPERVLQEDPDLLMYYDNATLRVE